MSNTPDTPIVEDKKRVIITGDVVAGEVTDNPETTTPPEEPKEGEKGK
jgi:hypothetical protein